MNLNYYIYNKYYMCAKERNLIWTSTDLAEKVLNLEYSQSLENENKIELYISDNFDKFQDNFDILTLEVTHFVFRHLNGPWGEVIDSLKEQIKSKHHMFLDKWGENPISNVEVNDWSKIY